MKYQHILVTGGAGFIGSFLTDALIKKGYKVRILDNLEDQVHKEHKPKYLNSKAQFVKGDVRDYDTLKRALKDIDVVYHLAASVGVAQSNYQIKKYSDTNIGSMANLLDLVVNNKTSVKKILMTASMTSYGEGDYRCKIHGVIKPQLRPESQLKKKDWSVYCAKCRRKVDAIPTTEESTINNNSIYSLSKNVQETMLMLTGRMYGIPVVSLRCFNVYGPRQSLSNPYTGVTAIFISRLKNNNPPVVYEDGLQSRDFISVHDVVAALIKGMESNKANYEIMNIGSGKPTSVKEVAETLAKLLKKKIAPSISRGFRVNDIRHCYADNRKAKKLLGWKPSVTLRQGFAELIRWSENEEAVDSFEVAQKELKEKKLL
jgi:dTDP-L-rhamnose 4-epimerase